MEAGQFRCFHSRKVRIFRRIETHMTDTSASGSTGETRTGEISTADTGERAVKPAILLGLKNRCPACGKGKLFVRFLKATPSCSSCGADMTLHAADDLPPYLSILVTGHIVVALMLEAETAFQPSVLFHMIAWPLMTLVLSLAFIQPLKGGVIGLQWAYRMHGFGPGGGNHQ